MRRILAGLLACCVAACDSSGETSLDQCSNGRDDDADGLADCADLACHVYAFCEGDDAGRPDAGPIDAAPRPDGAACARPIDLVIVADVSSSMVGALEQLEQESEAIVATVRALDASSTVSLVVFVDDALAVDECAPLADAASLSGALAARRALAPENRSPVSGTINQDCAENGLDALSLAVAECPWRAGAAHVILHVTDDTFAERPTVLSGPFGGGVLVQHTFDETADALVATGARVVALTRQGAGRDCGATTVSPDVGRGFHAPYLAMPSIPERTAGIVLDLDAWRDGTVDLAASIAAVAEPACQ